MTEQAAAKIEVGEKVIDLGSTAIKYLDDRAAESFKRQVDLEESIWRSLPLFSGALVAAGAILTSMAASLEPLSGSRYVTVVVLITGSSLAFLWSGWWLWQIVRPRTFDYPADDQAVYDYALELLQFHISQDVPNEQLDDRVTTDLRVYMANSFSRAAKSTFLNNQMRLSARSQVLLWLLIGFLLAFMCEATILSPKLLSPPFSKETTENAARRPIQPAQPSNAGAGHRTSTKPADARDSGRGLADQNQHTSTGPEQVNGGKN